MEFTATPATNEGILSLDGEITLPYAEQLKKLLVDALEASERVYIDTEAVIDIDLSCLQLLCAAHRSAADRGRQLILKLRRSEAFSAKILQAGLTRALDCDCVHESDCLWKGGNT